MKTTESKKIEWLEKNVTCPKCGGKIKVVQSRAIKTFDDTDFTFSCPNHGYFSVVIGAKNK